MPELPEVETIKNNLLSLIQNLTITKVEIKRSSTILGDPNLFSNTLKNKIIKDITRIGKFLIFHLSSNVVFISHLRMEGKYYKFEENEPDSKYARVVFYFNDHSKLCYDDSRCFGIMKLSDEQHYLKEKEIAKLGPEPFQINDVDYLVKKAKNKSMPIKTFLLDQSIMTGLGNIYVDETLFASKIHPLTPANFITKSQFEDIVANSIAILTSAIKSGGSTIKSYHPGKGIDGNFQVQLKVYGKKGENCPICGHPFRKIKVNGRGTTYCPICQKIKTNQLKVAIWGPVSSGKSTVLKQFANAGYETISCDQIVHNLYQDFTISKNIENMFNLHFDNGLVDIKVLREYLAKNVQEKRKLESYIHPLVKQGVECFIKKSSSPLVVVEVPLLYQAKMDTLFDYIIYISSKNAEKMLMNRNKDSAADLIKINEKDLEFIQKYKKEADIIIDNDFDLSSLNKKISTLISKLEGLLNQ